MEDKKEQKYAIPVGLASPGFKNVLDVGCKKKVLKNYLPKDIHYQGIDLFEDKEVIKYNLEKGIPFEDNSFDLVFALDILEHVDNVEFLLKEILRVAKKEAVIALPNMYFWIFRLRFLLFGRLSPHYDFYPEELGDRHKWLPSYYSAIDFVKRNSAGRKLEIIPRIHNHKSLPFLNIIDRTLIKFFPNFFSNGVFFRIELIK